MNIQVVTNEKGEKTAVLVPMADWEAIQKRLNTLQFYDEFESSMKEIKQGLEGKVKLKNIKNLLREHRD
jgi:PHD/YefM family antitoxin component YafN of YafNO toxin-antitoxin module